MIRRSPRRAAAMRLLLKLHLPGMVTVLATLNRRGTAGTVGTAGDTGNAGNAQGDF